MTSSALAKALIANCSLPETEWPNALTFFDSYISKAPPPGTILLALKHLLTIIIASFRERSASLMNCSAPPRITMVAAFPWLHFSKMLNRSAPSCLS
jgi:hypothetical protein